MNAFQFALLCGCAPQDTLTSIAQVKSKFGQITRFALMRTKTNAGADVSLTVADVVSASALALLAVETDETKIIESPIVHNPTPQNGSAIEYGSGNAVNGGIPFVVGTTPSSLELELLDSRQDTASGLNALNCTDIGVIFYDRCGNAFGVADSVSAPTTIKPIPLSNIFASQIEFGGLEAPNKNMVKLYYKNVEWSSSCAVVAAGTYNPVKGL